MVLEYAVSSNFLHIITFKGGKPESTTTSFRSRPFPVNFAVMFSRGSKGDGNLFASLSLAVKPSLRPKGTAQNGPPVWGKKIEENEIVNSITIMIKPCVIIDVGGVSH